jgi:hypothetical protein
MKQHTNRCRMDYNDRQRNAELIKLYSVISEVSSSLAGRLTRLEQRREMRKGGGWHGKKPEISTGS